MRTIKATVILIISMLFSSCSGDKVRMEEMCHELNLDIKENTFTQIKNETDGVGPDYTISIILKFDQNSLEKIVKQIVTSPHFNRQTENDTNIFFKKTLEKIHRRGIWKRNTTGYEFVAYYFTDGELVTSKIDTVKQTLEYTFTHL